MRVISTIPSKPRSNKFKYYSSNSSSSSSSSYTSLPNPDVGNDNETQYIAYFPNYQAIPTTQNTIGNLMIAITQDDNKLYVWDDDNSIWVDQTTGSSVTKIIAGNNITISSSPVANSGKGDVTINGTMPTITYTADTTANYDLWTDATVMSGSTIAARYKTLTQGTNVTLSAQGNNITINSTGSGLTYTQSGVGNTIATLSYNSGTNILAATLGYRFDSITTLNTGNTVLSLGQQNNALVVAMGNRMSGLVTNGSGNQVGSLSYNTANGTLTQNMTTVSGGGSNFNFVQGNQNLPMTKNLTWNSGTSTLTETRGYGYQFNNVGTGNGVTGVMPNPVSNPVTQDIPVSVTLGWYVNNVAENADTSSGFYFRSANAAPSITNSGFNSTLNLPYKQLQAGIGISLTNSGANVIITNTASGGSGGGNVISNLPIGSTTIRMYRYEYFLPSNLTINGYQNSSITVAKSAITGISSIFNYFPSLTYKSTSVTPVSVTLQIIDDGGTTFRILILNCNSSSVTVPINTEIDVLIFGI